MAKVAFCGHDDTTWFTYDPTHPDTEIQKLPVPYPAGAKSTDTLYLAHCGASTINHETRLKLITLQKEQAAAKLLVDRVSAAQAGQSSKITTTDDVLLRVKAVATALGHTDPILTRDNVGEITALLNTHHDTLHGNEDTQEQALQTALAAKSALANDLGVVTARAAGLTHTKRIGITREANRNIGVDRLTARKELLEAQKHAVTVETVRSNAAIALNQRRDLFSTCVTTGNIEDAANTQLGTEAERDEARKLAMEKINNIACTDEVLATTRQENVDVLQRTANFKAQRTALDEQTVSCTTSVGPAEAIQTEMKANSNNFSQTLENCENVVLGCKEHGFVMDKFILSPNTFVQRMNQKRKTTTSSVRSVNTAQRTIETISQSLLQYNDTDQPFPYMYIRAMRRPSNSGTGTPSVFLDGDDTAGAIIVRAWAYGAQRELNGNMAHTVFYPRQRQLSVKHDVPVPPKCGVGGMTVLDVPGDFEIITLSACTIGPNIVSLGIGVNQTVLTDLMASPVGNEQLFLIGAISVGASEYARPVRITTTLHRHLSALYKDISRLEYYIKQYSNLNGITLSATTTGGQDVRQLELIASTFLLVSLLLPSNKMDFDVLLPPPQYALRHFNTRVAQEITDMYYRGNLTLSGECDIGIITAIATTDKLYVDGLNSLSSTTGPDRRQLSISPQPVPTAGGSTVQPYTSYEHSTKMKYDAVPIFVTTKKKK
jgi:hypothetical protein